MIHDPRSDIDRNSSRIGSPQDDLTNLYARTYREPNRF
jgi:hypothetical protein